ncbi:hypothetical protein [Microbacterium sp.]|uniref:hypothetical protein n=1 Tax=Microbacterium sp. TaxID=51671 RepID=UPI003A929547
MTSAAISVRALRALSAGLLALGMLAACTPEPKPAPTPTKTALFSSDAEAFKAAEETYRAYTDALNNVDTSDPHTFESVYEFGSGTFKSGDKKNLSWMHAEKLKLGGETRVTRMSGVSTADNRSTVRVLACLDVSTVTLVDTEGTSRVNPTRPDKYGLSVTLKESHGRLTIDSAEVAQDQTCAE